MKFLIKLVPELVKNFQDVGCGTDFRSKSQIVTRTITKLQNFHVTMKGLALYFNRTLTILLAKETLNKTTQLGILNWQKFVHSNTE